MLVAFCLSVCLLLFRLTSNMLFWLSRMFVVFVFQYVVVVLAYEYVCCLFCLPVNVFCYFFYE